ncbi:NAD(P)-dependent alcohol dehydrogenase protein [Mycena sanguinolenta]|uniref:NAD(P)-dependent alcohol dehydrogenase protein n=1 Tax=Mycena sanguinolenta TaxID=230812 RepID=A0A8H6ZGL8_9AGAR|nr:NAD(P)-dependent alcohol dehydrogenase protein [Mycena sanguinolenta]
MNLSSKMIDPIFQAPRAPSMQPSSRKGIEFTVFMGSQTGDIVETTHCRDEPTGTQVLVKISHSGICGTDEHFRHVDMVLGHEGIGSVVQIGDRVTQFKIGDIVGWGFTHKTCGMCEQCLVGQDQYCPYKEMYGINNLDQGSHGSHAIWEQAYLFRIPDGLAPEHAAPLMCGGATVFEVIELYGIRPTDRVGVIGVGGLGHLAIQFLAKMGATVVVFSHTDSKRGDAMNLGASEFYATAGVEDFDIPPLDHLMVTMSSLPDWKPFLPIMKPKASIYAITIDLGNIVLPSLSVVSKGLRFQGSVGVARSVYERMFEFAVRNRVLPVIETFPLTRRGVEEGMRWLREGKMRYRGVLVAP